VRLGVSETPAEVRFLLYTTQQSESQSDAKRHQQVAPYTYISWSFINNGSRSFETEKYACFQHERIGLPPANMKKKIQELDKNRLRWKNAG
jgi:hypothetical protein